MKYEIDTSNPESSQIRLKEGKQGVIAYVFIQEDGTTIHSHLTNSRRHTLSLWAADRARYGIPISSSFLCRFSHRDLKLLSFKNDYPMEELTEVAKLEKEYMASKRTDGDSSEK